MDDNFEDLDRPLSSKPKSRIRGVSDFLLIIRDRWLLSLTLALPIALGFVYKELQVPEFFRSTSTFRLIPPPAIINLQKVDRTSQINTLISRHLDGINSQELRVNVVQKISENPESKSILLAPFLQEGIPIGVASTINYSVSVTAPSLVTQGLLFLQILGVQEVLKSLRILFSSNTKNYKSRKVKKLNPHEIYLNFYSKIDKAKKDELLRNVSIQEKKNPLFEDAKSSIFARKSQYQSK